MRTLILTTGKLRNREVQHLPQVTQLVTGSTGIRIQAGQLLIKQSLDLCFMLCYGKGHPLPTRHSLTVKSNLRSPKVQRQEVHIQVLPPPDTQLRVKDHSQDKPVAQISLGCGVPWQAALVSTQL
jgi:hypothetical protein